MSALHRAPPVIVCDGLDLTTACLEGIAAARRARGPVGVRWGQVLFELTPEDTARSAYYAFMDAARIQRRSAWPCR